MAQEPEFDFRDSLGVWCSKALTGHPFTRIVCADIIGSTASAAEVLENVFVGLTVLEAKQAPVARVALPVLGAGYQLMSPAIAAQELILATRRYLERSITAESVLFVEVDSSRAADFAEAMDAALGRESAILAPTQLVDSVRADLADALRRADTLFESDVSGLRDDWQRMLDSPVPRWTPKSGH
ncbi:MAG: hypothetical protein AB7M05_21060 [Alphaproteobacteria bacterium]